jgi:hypothetical protein
VATGAKPNILVTWGDDIGTWNLPCHGHGTKGYRTPNIDRLARGGVLFTDSYGEPIVPLRLSKPFDLRTDPLERADIGSNTHCDWLLSKEYMLGAARGIADEFPMTFKDSRPRERAAASTVGQSLETMKGALGSDGR